MKNLVFTIRNNYKDIGKIYYGVNKNVGYITNIRVNKKYRKKGIGTELLKHTENNLKNFYNIDTVKLVSWNSLYDNNNVNIFLEKNGYIKNDNTTFYDDYLNIYEITPLEKKL
mgnify:CR=1 FL=1|tara:strand:+ start:644 stop:982 length:339 start_codon:yes stop_codon:yes gene_type:complete